MSPILVPLAFLLLTLIPFGGQGPAPDPQIVEEAEPIPDALDRLYAELAAAESSAQANVIANQIETLWEISGSATADLLMDRAGEAMRVRDPDMAERHLDDALRIAPDHAEGWVRRAMLHTRRDEHSEALAALERALNADPRHYRALVTLARTLESMNSLQGAYEAYGEALGVHPFLEDAETQRRRLAPQVEGREL